MNNSILEDLQWRYTTKSYDPNKKVSEQDIETILTALRLSASSINSQPWRFIVLESDHAKQRFNKTFANKFQLNQPHAMNASHIILFAHKPYYDKNDYEYVIKQNIQDGRLSPEKKDTAIGAFSFAELYTDPSGYNADWTRAQLYLALGNILHVLARMKIDSTSMEGIDVQLVQQEFKEELNGYTCPFALAIGYRHQHEDYNAELPKSRLPAEKVILKI